MSIIPIIFFALFGVLGFGLGNTETTFSQQAVPADPGPAAAPAYSSDLTISGPAAHQMFVGRAPLQPCGSWECLQQSATGTGAELDRAEATDEGDLVTTYYRATHGALEIFTEDSKDAFRGSRAWSYQSCTVPADVRMGCPSR